MHAFCFKYYYYYYLGGVLISLVIIGVGFQLADDNTPAGYILLSMGHVNSIFQFYLPIYFFFYNFQ